MQLTSNANVLLVRHLYKKWDICTLKLLCFIILRCNRQKISCLLIWKYRHTGHICCMRKKVNVYLMRPINIYLIREYKKDCITYTKNSLKILLFAQGALPMHQKCLFLTRFELEKVNKCLYSVILAGALAMCRIFLINVIQ